MHSEVMWSAKRWDATHRLARRTVGPKAPWCWWTLVAIRIKQQVLGGFSNRGTYYLLSKILIFITWSRIQSWYFLSILIIDSYPVKQIKQQTNKKVLWGPYIHVRPWSLIILKLKVNTIFRIISTYNTIFNCIWHSTPFFANKNTRISIMYGQKFWFTFFRLPWSL